MKDSEINSLNDLRRVRTAPKLDANQEKKLLKELALYINNADWFTIGIMANSSKQAINVLKEIEVFFSWSEMKAVPKEKGVGPVFLKANQKTGSINIRIEYGLGEGVLLSCQYNDDMKDADTLGPFPLNLFKHKDTSNQG